MAQQVAAAENRREAAAAAVTGPRLGTMLARSEFFALLFAVTCANGLVAKALDTVRQSDWIEAAVGTFGVSAIVWFACYAGLALVVRGDGPVPRGRDLPRGPDWILAAAVLGMAAVPFGAFSWAAQTCLAVYVIRMSTPQSPQCRGAWILLAVTVPMCWSRLLFAFLSRWILEADAILVSSVLGTERIGNTVRFSNEPDFFQIFPACSSLANMSLAILCWVTVAKMARHRATPTDAVWCALACLSVVIVNVARISLIGLHRDSFDLIHGPVGATIAAWIALAFMVGISLWSVRRDFVRV